MAADGALADCGVMSDRPPDLHMLNLVVGDVSASLDFYRRLGIAADAPVVHAREFGFHIWVARMPGNWFPTSEPPLTNTWPSASTVAFDTVPAGSAGGLGVSAACAHNLRGTTPAATTAPVPATRAMKSRRDNWCNSRIV